jgi:hypothetical protein
VCDSTSRLSAAPPPMPRPAEGPSKARGRLHRRAPTRRRLRLCAAGLSAALRAPPPPPAAGRSARLHTPADAQLTWATLADEPRMPTALEFIAICPRHWQSTAQSSDVVLHLLCTQQSGSLRPSCATAACKYITDSTTNRSARHLQLMDQLLQRGVDDSRQPDCKLRRHRSQRRGLHARRCGLRRGLHADPKPSRPTSQVGSPSQLLGMQQPL